MTSPFIMNQTSSSRRKGLNKEYQKTRERMDRREERTKNIRNKRSYLIRRKEEGKIREELFGKEVRKKKGYGKKERKKERQERSCLIRK